MLGLVMAIALAGAAPPPSQSDCAEAVSTVEVNACLRRDLEGETARMERYLGAARQIARDSDRESAGYGDASQRSAYLQAGQTAWKAYADIVCDGVYDRWRAGTIRGSKYLGCMTQMTRERTHVVWRDYLTFVDSTPPVLPEPTGVPDPVPLAAEPAA